METAVGLATDIQLAKEHEAKKLHHVQNYIYKHKTKADYFSEYFFSKRIRTFDYRFGHVLFWLRLCNCLGDENQLGVIGSCFETVCHYPGFDYVHSCCI